MQLVVVFCTLWLFWVEKACLAGNVPEYELIRLSYVKEEVIVAEVVTYHTAGGEDDIVAASFAEGHHAAFVFRLHVAWEDESFDLSI